LEVILATHNPHKLAEFRAIFKAFAPTVDLITLRAFPHYPVPEETGTTFEENAKLKALAAAKDLGGFALADDSGLVVPALEGRPGVYSARYAGPGATDFDNRKKLIREMEGLEGLHRSAYFECVLVLASPEGVKIVARGKVEGTIVEAERGRNGFGYDPLFQKLESNKTFAELDEQTKNRISHRRKAFDKLMLSWESLKL
jgi:XTP/dITP diphosphohydrolase